MWLLSYFKRSVGNCHSASERGMTVTNRLFEIQNNTIFYFKERIIYTELTLK